MAPMVRNLDDRCCLREAVPHVDALNGWESCACDGAGYVHHSLQPLAFLSIGIAIPGHDAMFKILYLLNLLKCVRVLSVILNYFKPKKIEVLAPLLSDHNYMMNPGLAFPNNTPDSIVDLHTQDN